MYHGLRKGWNLHRQYWILRRLKSDGRYAIDDSSTIVLHTVRMRDQISEKGLHEMDKVSSVESTASMYLQQVFSDVSGEFGNRLC